MLSIETPVEHRVPWNVRLLFRNQKRRCGADPLQIEYLARPPGNRRSGYCWQSAACKAVFLLGLEWLLNGRRQIREYRRP